jgi:cell division protein FtsN
MTPPKPAPAGPPAEGYRIQVGVFGSKANADKLVQDLSNSGRGTFDILTGQNAKGLFYRVVSAVYTHESDAREASARLDQQGIANAVKRVSEL